MLAFLGTGVESKFRRERPTKLLLLSENMFGHTIDARIYYFAFTILQQCRTLVHPVH